MIGLNLESHKSSSIAICESFVKNVFRNSIEHRARSMESGEQGTGRRAQGNCEKGETEFSARSGQLAAGRKKIS